MKMHTTKDGRKIRLQDMTDAHLSATISLFERRAEKGIAVTTGGGYCAEDIWFDEEVVFGEEALEHLGYADYVKERDRRSSNAVLGSVCPHGQLQRSCELCERDAVIDNLRAQLQILREAMRETDWLHFCIDHPEALTWFDAYGRPVSC